MTPNAILGGNKETVGVMKCQVTINIFFNKCVPISTHFHTNFIFVLINMFYLFLVNYLLYGPYGSFGPTYDTSLSNTTKEESDLLLQTYASEGGVEYVKR